MKKAKMPRRQGKVMIVLLAAFLLVFPAGLFPVAAAPATPAGESKSESEAEAVLTYDTAVEMALKNSTELKNAREGVLQAEEMRDQLANLRLITGFTPVGPGYDLFDAAARELLLNFTAADTAERMSAKQVEILEGALVFQVRSAYDEVLQITAGLAKADRALAFALKKLIQTETKTRLGTESNFNRENARSSYAAEKEQKEHLARKLDGAYTSLNKLLGLEPGARPKLQEYGGLPVRQKEGPEGEPKQSDDRLEKEKEAASPLWLDEAGLERRLALILHDHPYIWLQEQKVAQAERELSLYTYNVGAPSYKVVASAVQQEKNSLYALKEEVGKGVRSLYYQLQGLESQYKALENNLAQAENGLRVTQLRLKLGMAVPLEVEQMEMTVLEIKDGMQDLARAYGQLQMLLEKPWLMQMQPSSAPSPGQ